jgi:hypothetical protein
MRFSPLVGVFGHRQVGKSTFISNEIEDYRTLDDVDSLDAASSSPKTFVEHSRNSPMAIDECQLEPRLFPTLKERVRTDRRPGQYVLSGSVRFTSRKVIRESLAGRLAMVELLPLTVAELAATEFSATLPQLLGHRQFGDSSLRALRSGRELVLLQKHFAQFLEHGGLPGVCFIRNPELKRKALADLHDLILARDLPLVADVRTPSVTLKRLLSQIARQPFEVYNSSEIRRTLGLSIPTQKKLLDAMESVFLIRRVAIPVRKKWSFLLEDQFEEALFAGGTLSLIRVIETALFRNLRAQFEYSLESAWETEIYLTRDGARIPLVFRIGDEALGVLVFEGTDPGLRELRAGASFLKNHARGKVIYASSSAVATRVLDARSLVCSAAALL